MDTLDAPKLTESSRLAAAMPAALRFKGLVASESRNRDVRSP
jgi:hypothetical protein